MAARKQTTATPQAPAVESAADQTPAEAPEHEAPPVEGAVSDYVAALRYEREGYLRYGLKERAAAVDAELKRAERE